MHRTQLSELAPALSGPQRVLLETSRDAGVGSWLTAEPLASCGFVLNKSAFRDAVAIRYGWPLDELPSSCVCGAAMTLDHAAVCPTGGYPSLRHNEIRDLLAEVFSAVISDVRIEPTLLPLTACRASTADFTTGLSGYTQATSIDQFDWTRKQGATSSRDTGPLSDHSSGSGHYLYIEASPPSFAGDKAIIYSPHYTTLHAKVCTFSFWYHMYGDDIGTLNVYVKTSTANVRVFTQSGHKGNNWLHARVLLNTVPAVTPGPFQLSFEGICGRGPRSDIAIDDIGFEDDCSSGNPSASCNALGSLLIALTDVHNQTSYDLVITMIAANNTPEVVTLHNQMLSSTYHPSAIPADLATTQVIVAVFAVGTTTPLNVYIKDESEVTQNNLLAMMKDSRNYMMQGMVAGSAASPTRPLTAQTTWKVAGTPTPTAHYRIFNADCYGSSPPDTCTRPTYRAISVNASSLTFLTYGVYEVVFQVTTGSGPTAKTKYITPPLRLTVNTDIILGQTPVCPLPTAVSPMVNVPCTCKDGFSWNSTRCTALGSLLIALTDVHNQTSYDLVITMIAANNTPEVVTLHNQMLSSTYHPSAIPAGLATTQVVVAVFAVGSTTPLNVYIKDESEVTQNNLLAMMKDSRNYMMQGTVASSAASPTRPLTAQTTWKVAGTPTPTAHYRIFNADCYGSSPPDTCNRPTYTAISMNASSPTSLLYGVYEVVFQVTTGSGPTAKTKYITPPLRLTVNTDIILGQTPLCPLNIPACTCSAGFSWNSTRCATVGSHLIAAGVPTGTNGTIVLQTILGMAVRPTFTSLTMQTVSADLIPSQVTSTTNFVANMTVGMTSYAAVLYSMSPALAQEAVFTAILSGFTNQDNVLIQTHIMTHNNTSTYAFAPNVATNAEYRVYNSLCYEATPPASGCEWTAFTSPLNLKWDTYELLFFDQTTDMTPVNQYKYPVIVFKSDMSDSKCCARGPFGQSLL
ncbi:uncharacterized protein LOC135827200 [Sycon ciliatum]|uniref:uncharacterized protein LOC135827200 n=1 Tax=Sycon ciliatum TaxID=27933 RepID=UPI0031F5F8EF